MTDIALEKLQHAYEGGDKAALFHAIRHCALWGQVLPDWTREALDLAYLRLGSGDGWSGIFGEPPTKKWVISEARAMRDAEELQAMAAQAEADDVSRNEEWFVQAGRKLKRGVRGKTRVKQLLKKPTKWWQG